MVGWNFYIAVIHTAFAVSTGLYMAGWMAVSNWQGDLLIRGASGIPVGQVTIPGVCSTLMVHFLLVCKQISS